MTTQAPGTLTSDSAPMVAAPSAAPSAAGRLEAVRRYGVLDAPVDPVLERVARLAARIFGTPIGAVTIVDQDRIWFAAIEGLDGVQQIGTDPGLCTTVIGQREPYLVTDAVIDPRTRENPLVTGPLGLRFYAAVPIVTPDGHALGTVNAIDQQPRAATDGQLAMLVELAGVVAEHLETRAAAIRAVEAEQQAVLVEQELRADADRRAAAAAELTAQLQAAGRAHRSQRPPSSCELGGPAGCDRQAELKVADSWGDSAWGCIEHAEEALMGVSAVFIATEELGGLTAYVNRGRR